MLFNLISLLSNIVCSTCHRVEIHNEYTDTENSDCDNENESKNDGIGPILQYKYFFGKDNTRWIKKVPTTVHRTRAHNIIINLPSPKATVENMKTHLESFFIFYDENVINIIVRSINIEITSVRGKY